MIWIVTASVRRVCSKPFRDGCVTWKQQSPAGLCEQLSASFRVSRKRKWPCPQLYQHCLLSLQAPEGWGGWALTLSYTHTHDRERPTIHLASLGGFIVKLQTRVIGHPIPSPSLPKTQLVRSAAAAPLKR